MRLSIGLPLLGLFIACGPNTEPPAGQIIARVTTDAPVPVVPPSTDSTPPLFDRLLIEVFPPSASADCVDGGIPCDPLTSREIALDSAMLGDDGLSFGIALPPHVGGYELRCRLYDAGLGDGPIPPPRNVVDRVVSLPAVPEQGDPTTVGIVLYVDDVGNEADLANPEEPTLGRPPNGLVGTWPGARRVPCAGAPGPDEVCVSGGAFWMGVPDRIGTPTAPDVPSARLVQVSPFYMQTTEVTVQSMRDSGMARPPDPQNAADPGDPGRWNPDEFDPWYYGTWADDDVQGWPFQAPPRDMPVAGATWELARAFCQAKGADLPTEAQFEYASGGLENRRYVWGSDDPTCQDAVWGRAGAGIVYVMFSDCRTGNDVGGPMQPRSGRRDQLVLAGGTIYDLAGNMFEWARDMWNRQDEPCWTPTLMRDPLCLTPSTDSARYSVRGGGWPLVAAALRPPSRIGFDSLELQFFLPAIGFRCVRAG